MMYMYLNVFVFRVIYFLKRWRNDRYLCILNIGFKFVKIIGFYIFYLKNKSFLNLLDFDCKFFIYCMFRGI